MNMKVSLYGDRRQLPQRLTSATQVSFFGSADEGDFSRPLRGRNFGCACTHIDFRVRGTIRFASTPVRCRQRCASVTAHRAPSQAARPLFLTTFECKWRSLRRIAKDNGSRGSRKSLNRAVAKFQLWASGRGLNIGYRLPFVCHRAMHGCCRARARVRTGLSWGLSTLNVAIRAMERGRRSARWARFGGWNAICGA
jgi:hypothetical protein